MQLPYCKIVLGTHKLVAAHMQALLEVPNPNNNLRTFHDTIESHSRGLATLGKSEQTYGDLLVPIILGKLPKDVKQNLARRSTSREWTFSQLMSAILREIEFLKLVLVTLTSPQLQLPFWWIPNHLKTINLMIRDHNRVCFARVVIQPTSVPLLTTIED